VGWTSSLRSDVVRTDSTFASWFFRFPSLDLPFRRLPRRNTPAAAVHLLGHHVTPFRPFCFSAAWNVGIRRCTAWRKSGGSRYIWKLFSAILDDSLLELLLAIVKPFPHAPLGNARNRGRHPRREIVDVAEHHGKTERIGQRRYDRLTSSPNVSASALLPLCFRSGICGEIAGLPPPRAPRNGAVP